MDFKNILCVPINIRDVRSLTRIRDFFIEKIQIQKSLKNEKIEIEAKLGKFISRKPESQMKINELVYISQQAPLLLNEYPFDYLRNDYMFESNVDVTQFDQAEFYLNKVSKCN